MLPKNRTAGPRVTILEFGCGTHASLMFSMAIDVVVPRLSSFMDLPALIWQEVGKFLRSQLVTG